MDSGTVQDSHSLQTPFGPLTLRGDGVAVTEIAFASGLTVPGPQYLQRAGVELLEYFEGRRTQFTFPVAPRGTAFQLRVWAALREIPYGKTTTYGQLAARLGVPGGARAVGGAAGRNPCPIVIPCHRLLAANGLGGFSGGLEWKRNLLSLEARSAT